MKGGQVHLRPAFSLHPEGKTGKFSYIYFFPSLSNRRPSVVAVKQVFVTSIRRVKGGRLREGGGGGEKKKRKEMLIRTMDYLS